MCSCDVSFTQNQLLPCRRRFEENIILQHTSFCVLRITREEEDPLNNNRRTRTRTTRREGKRKRNIIIIMRTAATMARRKKRSSFSFLLIVLTNYFQRSISKYMCYRICSQMSKLNVSHNWTCEKMSELRWSSVSELFINMKCKRTNCYDDHQRKRC